ncbi:hypothetical protein BXZ70DRAFT_1013367 [Cristinia sonorae]|uniref:CxC2-like cysteine cluster KDZ transposase-associated domain-containing protein n=1 Tax=Cristinia sonorae TaxID=1940300 RepID=A0A8K0UC96_9AGAR|nr:hypothetical protein BXZ70DRAFT_1013367 [Cristinia sonorae]
MEQQILPYDPHTRKRRRTRGPSIHASHPSNPQTPSSVISSINLTTTSTRRLRKKTVHISHSQAIPLGDDFSSEVDEDTEEGNAYEDQSEGFEVQDHLEVAEFEHEEEGEEGEESEGEVDGGLSSTKGRSETNKDRLGRWIPFRDQFLDELIRWDGYCDAVKQTACIHCKLADAEYRCRDCYSTALWCAGCLVANHAHLPFHRVEISNGCYFKKTSLHTLGLVVQLGHGGRTCKLPAPPTKPLKIVHTSGVHLVQISYCSCSDHRGQTVDRWTQILRAGWYPATVERPQTAFTFEVLDLFLELNWQAKTNLNDFYKTLEQLTDKTGIESEQHLYRQMGLVVRQWRNLHALKRGGRGHDPSGAAGTSPGELAIECAACPQPGRNLPQGWETSEKDKLWLYFLMLMVDANFRLRCKDRGLDDVELGSGWSFFVEENAYLRHEAITCGAEHKAIIKANLRKEGYIASGVGAVMCARHSLARLCGMGDLQKGEKYCNMDYLILSTLAGLTWLYVLISYDIACQFSVNFFKRMETYPEELQRDFDILRWVIPKKHISVHGRDHSRFSLNFLRWVGRTYGEGIESSWHFNNPLSGQTSEMATGLRHEVHDDNWNAWNWLKTISFGSHFLKQLKLALKQSDIHRQLFEEHDSLYKTEDTDQWHEDLQRWYNNPNSKPDPFEEPATGLSVKSVQEKLAREEAETLAHGDLPPHEVSPADFIQVGLELEEQQRVLQKEIKDKTREGVSLQQKRNTLLRRIMAWRLIQDVYLPGAASLRKPDLMAEEMDLLFPSALPVAFLVGDLAEQVTNIEFQLRRAQIEDALSNLRHWRRTMEKVTQFKNLNVRGTGNKANTRMRAVYSRFKSKATLAVERYRTACAALLELDPDGDWQERFKILQDQDNRGPGAEDPENDTGQRSRYQRRQGEGYHQASWIWRVGSEVVDQDSDVYSASMQVEWSKMLARAERWEEEVLLIQEEMRRTVVFFQWKATEWRKQAGNRVNGIPIELLSGLNAYAQKQGDMWDRLAVQCVEKWYKVVQDKDIREDWMANYPSHCRENKGKGKAVDKDDRMDID